MTDKIRVLIVDDLPETRENVRKLLQFEPDIEVIGQAGNGEQAIAMAKDQLPDVVLMDINMPGVDGIGASQAITQAISGVQTIIMSVQSESDYLRRAMLAGARDFLMKPFSGDQVATAIRRVYESRPASVPQPTATVAGGGSVGTHSEHQVNQGHIISVFSPKGGSGCTTVAISLAASLARKGHRTVLIDGSLQFGDVAFMLNLKPTTTLVDLADHDDELDADLISSATLTHVDDLNVMLAPARPEMADHVTADYMQLLLDNLSQAFEYVVVDTSSHLSDVTVALLDRSTRIVLVLQQSLPSIKNARLFLDVSNSLDYEANKIKLVINRAVKRGVTIERIVSAVKRPIVATIPDDEAAAGRSVSEGTPIVSGRDAKRPIAAALNSLADQLVEDLGSDGVTAEEETEVKSSRLSRLFGR